MQDEKKTVNAQNSSGETAPEGEGRKEAPKDANAHVLDVFG